MSELLSIDTAEAELPAAETGKKRTVKKAPAIKAPAEIAFDPVTRITTITSKDEIDEFIARILKGLLKIVRAYGPTVEDVALKKKVRPNVPMVDGIIAISTEHSVPLVVIEPLLAEFCKKKSAVRDHLDAMEQQYKLTLTFDYDKINDFLKIYEKNIKTIEISDTHIKLSVIGDTLSHTISSDVVGKREAAATIARYGQLLADENHLYGAFKIEKDALPAEAVTIGVTADGIQVMDTLTRNYSGAQIRIRGKLINTSDVALNVYKYQGGGFIFQFTQEKGDASIDMLYRAISY